MDETLGTKHDEWVTNYKKRKREMDSEFEKVQASLLAAQKRLKAINDEKYAVSITESVNRNKLIKVLSTGTVEEFKTLMDGINKPGTCAVFHKTEYASGPIFIWQAVSERKDSVREIVQLLVKMGVTEFGTQNEFFNVVASNSHSDFTFGNDVFVAALLEFGVIKPDMKVLFHSAKSKQYGIRHGPLIYRIIIDKDMRSLEAIERWKLNFYDPGIEVNGEIKRAGSLLKDAYINVSNYPHVTSMPAKAETAKSLSEPKKNTNKK